MVLMVWHVVTAAEWAALREPGDGRVEGPRGRHQEHPQMLERSHGHAERHTYRLWCMGSPTGSIDGLRCVATLAEAPGQRSSAPSKIAPMRALNGGSKSTV
jgi:hypothetical protein